MTKGPKLGLKNFISKPRGIIGFVSIPVFLIGCGYYPRNQAAIAVPANKTLTFTGSVLPTKVKTKENEFDEIVRMESLTGATWKFESDKIFISPSLYYLGFGSGVGYIFSSKTVLAGYIGMSFLPFSQASGLSVSQAILNHYFIEYRLNYSKLHYLNCAFSCYEEDGGELSVYHTFNLATLFGPFYSEFSMEVIKMRKDYIFYGISAGVQIHLKSEIK